MNSPKTKLIALALFCLLLVLLTPFGGMSFISPASIFPLGSPDSEVFWWMRLPRTAASFLSGAGLALGGLVFQAMFRNPLATPFTLGVSSGAALGAATYFWLGAGAVSGSIMGSFGSMGAALCGGLLSMCLVYSITRARGGFSTPVMLLAGVIISFFFSSLVMFIQYLSASNDSLRITHWLMGSLTGLDLPRLPDLAFVIFAGGLIIWRMAPELDLLLAGEELAASRGVDVRRTKISLFAISSLMVGGIVSIAGPIGFVGMIIPHLCRLWLGPAHGSSHRWLIPACFFSGGCFLTLCDLLARSLIAPAELPIGIITSLAGGPFFLWVLFHTGKRGELF